MPRIRPLREDEASEELHYRFKSDKATFGRALDSTGIYAYVPEIAKAVAAIGPSIQRSGLLSEALKRMLNVKAALMVGCPF